MQPMFCNEIVSIACSVAHRGYGMVWLPSHECIDLYNCCSTGDHGFNAACPASNRVH